MTRNSKLSKRVGNFGVLACLFAAGACDSDPDQGEAKGPGGMGGGSDSRSSGGLMAAAGGNSSPSGGADASAGGSPDPGGGAAADGGASSDGGAPAGNGGEAFGGFGGEVAAVGGGAAESGSGGRSDGVGGASESGSGGMSSGGHPAVNFCLEFLDRTDEVADGEITWNFGIDTDEERCLQIRVGQSVTWDGNFNFHPLVGNGGTTPNPIIPQDEGSGPYPVQFTAEGTFGFICDAHVEMRGAVRVVP